MIVLIRILCVIGLIIILIPAILFLLVFAGAVRSAKYDYILEKDEHGQWHYEPVFHPCGEPIDEEFIKLWNEREEQCRRETEV